jgi:hypothetical protein
VWHEGEPSKVNPAVNPGGMGVVGGGGGNRGMTRSLLARRCQTLDES